MKKDKIEKRKYLLVNHLQHGPRQGRVSILGAHGQVEQPLGLGQHPQHVQLVAQRNQNIGQLFGLG